MKQLLKQIHRYLRRKLRELKPEFISISVFVPMDVHRDLEDEYQSEKVGGRPSVSFKEGEWPDQTVLNFTPIPEEEE
jgi:hypothetical protein